jgi:hypothetical protein
LRNQLKSHRIVLGGRDNAKMIKKSLFQMLSTPAKDGNFFLRPDRIIGAFFLPASRPPVGLIEAKAALASEREKDVATKERIDSVQREMSRWGDQLQQTNKELRCRRSEGTQQSDDCFDANKLSGIEMSRCDPFRHSSFSFEDRFQGKKMGIIPSDNDPEELPGNSVLRIDSSQAAEGIVLGPESVRLTMVVNSSKDQEQYQRGRGGRRGSGEGGGEEDKGITGSHGMHPFFFDADDETDMRVSVTRSIATCPQDLSSIALASGRQPSHRSFVDL